MANGTTDRALLSRFWSSASGFWKGKSAISAWLLTLSVLAMGVAQLFVQYRLNYWNRDFFDALERRDSAGLWQQAMIFAPLACLSVGLKVASVWGRMTTQRKWREWLTTDILSNWLSKERYRRLELAGGETKNAEYRISYDARTATDAPVDLALGLVTSVMTAVVFFNVLWSVGGDLTFGVAGIELTLPGYLVVGVCIYSLLFTGMMMIIGRKLPETIQFQSQAEAEFLAAAHQIRDLNTHQHAVAAEIEKLRSAFRDVLRRWRQLNVQLMGITLVTQADLLFASVVAWILCAPKYLTGAMTLGELIQASAAFVTLQLAFNWLVDNYQHLSDWRSAVNRVATLLMALDEVALSENETPASSATSGMRGPLHGKNEKPV